MKIQKVKIHGVGSYADTTEIVFSIDPKKPITVAHGENGAGKTSTLNAILWCFTGRLSAKLTAEIGADPTKFFNRDLGEGEVPFVEIDFELDGEEFKARRDGGFSNLSGEFHLKKLRGSTWDPYATGSEATMTNILPASIARYFIFDGEGFQAKTPGDNSVGTAVKTILGFDHVESAIASMQQVIREREQYQSKLQSAAIRDQQKKRSFERATEQLEKEKTAFAELSQEAQDLSAELEQTRTAIDGLNITRVNTLRREEQELEREIARINNEITGYELSQLSFIGKYYRAAFGTDLFASGFRVIEEKREKGVIPGKYSRQLIEDLKQSGICICGKCLDDADMEVLESKIKDGFTDGLQQRLQEAGACKRDDAIKLSGFKTEHSMALASINQNRKELGAKNARLREVKEGLNDLDGYEEKVAELRNQEVRLDARIKTIGQDKTSILDRIQQHKHTRDNYAGNSVDSSDEQKKITRDIEILRSVADYARAQLDDEFVYAKEFIEREMNAFIESTNIAYAVTLDSNFNFCFRDVRGSAVLGSTGEGKTLEFAFLSSLMKLIQEKSSDGVDGLLQPGSRIPIVLDAPFSELAENYISYISDMLLSVSDQLTVLMINKDWWAFEAACDDKIGKEFVLVKNLKAEAKGKLPVSEEFGGKKYQCVVYDSEKDCTTLETVR